MPALIHRISVLLILISASCARGDGTKPPTAHETRAAAPTCGDGKFTPVKLGSPYRHRDPARFETSGGALYLTAHAFLQGGVLDPDTPSTRFHVGSAATQPTYDEQRGLVTPALQEVVASKDEWVKIELRPGRYWLWSSAGGDVEAATCPPGRVQRL